MSQRSSSIRQQGLQGECASASALPHLHIHLLRQHAECASTSALHLLLLLLLLLLLVSGGGGGVLANATIDV